MGYMFKHDNKTISDHISWQSGMFTIELVTSVYSIKTFK